MPHSEQEVAAMRAYLQRAEVRLSTFHRVAAAFLSGAGLLALFPFIATQGVTIVTTSLVDFWFLMAESPSEHRLHYCMLLIPVTFSTLLLLGVPLLALALLLKDLIQFYFSPNVPGSPEPKKGFFPRFALTGITFAKDESDPVRQTIWHQQSREHNLHFVLPYREQRWREILPAARDMLQAAQEKNNASDALGSAKQPYPRADIVQQHVDEIGRRSTGPGTTENTIQEEQDKVRTFHGSFYLAGAADRSLEEEVTKMETSLVRHNLALRRLMLRYVKALVLFIVATLAILLLASAFNRSGNDIAQFVSERTQVLVGIALALFAFFAPYGVRRPIVWIFEYASEHKLPWIREPDLVSFERTLFRLFFVHAAVWVLCGFVLAADKKWVSAVVCWAVAASGLVYLLWNELSRFRREKKLNHRLEMQASSPVTAGSGASRPTLMRTPLVNRQ